MPEAPTPAAETTPNPNPTAPPVPAPSPGTPPPNPNPPPAPPAPTSDLPAGVQDRIRQATEAKKEAEKRAAQAEKELNEIKDRDLSEKDKAERKAQQAEERAQAAEQRATLLERSAWARAAASEAGFVNSQDAVDLLASKLGTEDLDSEEKVKAAVAALKEERPHLAPVERPGIVPGFGTLGGAPPPGPVARPGEALTPEQAKEGMARDIGSLLMGRGRR